MYFCIVRAPTSSPTCAQTVFTEFVNAVVRSMVAEGLAAGVVQRDARDLDAVAAVDGAVRLRTSRCRCAAIAVTTLNVEPGG